jgi:pimeloyl-ACP methyl ester carboxylesterase
MKTKIISLLALLMTSVALIAGADSSEPKPTGELVDLGGFRLHVNCTGKGSPTVVVENGLGDFSIDWILVQERVAHFARVCTYDRAGYAWSDPGPLLIARAFSFYLPQLICFKQGRFE